MYEKLTKMPELYCIHDSCPKISKIPEFYMIFTRKMPEFYIIIARKNFVRIFFFLGGGARAPLPPRLLRPW